MKAIMVMFDSLNRRLLPNYGCDWTHMPNFNRLAKKTVTFDNSYVGSMPCIPARRDLHTGRYNFLHRSWGPIEPFDDSMPEILKNNGIYTHLVSDHYHYWEDGGATYHKRYSSWEIVRGQEADSWKGEVKDPEIPETVGNTGKGELQRSNWVNRKYMTNEEEHYQHKTFSLGMEFIEKNCNEDNWFLQIETFDPHEPYFVPEKYRNMYPHNYDGPVFDWPPYRRIQETREEIEHCLYENAALHSMCDEYLGKVLEIMDEKNMWEDTMLIVNTDHGFLLGEHGWWAKCVMPFYGEVANTPLFIWDPRTGKKDERRSSVVQIIDIAPTLYELFNVPIPKDVQGKSLKDTIAHDKPVREAALFGIHGGQINVTDGRYVYMRSPARTDNKPLYQYTLMPTRHGAGRAFISLDEIRTAQLAEPFSFTKGCKLMKLESEGEYQKFDFPTVLFDIENDPKQENPIKNKQVEEKMINYMIQLMKENDAPKEQYERMGLNSKDI
jgi:arylsulfatase A-like enzyme